MACKDLQTVRVSWEWGLQSQENNFKFLKNMWQYTDFTISCADGQHIRVHKAVLMKNSLYFRSLLTSIPFKLYEPVMVLQYVPFWYVRELVAFMYEPDVVIPIVTYEQFMRFGKQLMIKGLCSYASWVD